jgi:tetratricopeptide (TPR) repeat protein
MTGQSDNAGTAAAHVATLQRLPPEVTQATSLFSDGELLPAENIIRAYLLKHGSDIEAMRLLARIGIERDVLDDAELLLDAVLQLAPGYQAARYDFALVLAERHKYAAARQELEALLKVEPTNRQYRTLYARTCVGLGELRGAPRRCAGGSRSTSVGCPFTQNAGPAGGVHRGVPGHCGDPAEFWRRLVEPGESEDLPLHR